MGKKKKKAPKVEYNPVSEQLSQQSADLSSQYQQQIASIQQTSQQSLEQINQSNQAAVTSIQNQLAQANQEKINYQQSLQDYLRQLGELQGNYNKELAGRDAAVKQQQNLQSNEIDANSQMSALLAASQVAQKSFTQRTKRRGVIA